MSQTVAVGAKPDLAFSLALPVKEVVRNPAAPCRILGQTRLQRCRATAFRLDRVEHEALQLDLSDWQFLVRVTRRAVCTFATVPVATPLVLPTYTQ